MSKKEHVQKEKISKKRKSQKRENVQKMLCTHRHTYDCMRYDHLGHTPFMCVECHYVWNFLALENVKNEKMSKKSSVLVDMRALLHEVTYSLCKRAGISLCFFWKFKNTLHRHTQCCMLCY